MAGPPNSSSVRITDGTFDFSGGVDSISVPVVLSALNPDGMQRNQLCWLDNATVRDGGISQRWGWQKLAVILQQATNSLYQGGFVYLPDVGDPYLICSVAGVIYSVTFQVVPIITNLSLAFNLFNPSQQVKSYFVQGEQFLVIQAGDGITPPLFWDGFKLRRSNGLSVVYGVTPELPAATCMDYFMGRIWYAQSRTVSAGDIVQGPSGTIGYKFRDSILKVTENPLAVGGDGFSVPTSSGSVVAVTHSANIDAALGQGLLIIATRKSVYNLQVPVTRAAWSGADASNMPLLAVVQIGNGMANDRSVVKVNGDLFFQSIEPSIRSLSTSMRYFQQWGNVPISTNEFRLISQNDRSLMDFGSGIEFDTRMLQAMLPRQTNNGVVHDAIVPLDYSTISDFGKNLNPEWEGMYEGLSIFQLYTANFGGLERAFAVALSPVDGSIALWELTTSSLFENGDNRITMVAELPAFHWDREFQLKQLDAIEIFFDRLWGATDFEVYYKSDQFPCFQQWAAFTRCAARNPQEDPNAPAYPMKPYLELYAASVMLGPPPDVCNVDMQRPMNVGYQFQVLIKVTGRARIRGILLHALPLQKSPYDGLACS